MELFPSVTGRTRGLTSAVAACATRIARQRARMNGVAFILRRPTEPCEGIAFPRWTVIWRSIIVFCSATDYCLLMPSYAFPKAHGLSSGQKRLWQAEQDVEVIETGSWGELSQLWCTGRTGRGFRWAICFSILFPCSSIPAARRLILYLPSAALLRRQP